MRWFLFLLVLSIQIADAKSRIKRSSKAVRDFRISHMCPSTGAYTLKCPGYIVDHINPLACGGDDHPRNMQYQTVKEAKAKDRWERKGCQI